MIPAADHVKATHFNTNPVQPYMASYLVFSTKRSNVLAPNYALDLALPYRHRYRPQLALFLACSAKALLMTEQGPKRSPTRTSLRTSPRIAIPVSTRALNRGQTRRYPR